MAQANDIATQHMSEEMRRWYRDNPEAANADGCYVTDDGQVLPFSDEDPFAEIQDEPNAELESDPFAA